MLRDPTGADERDAAGADADRATRLLGRLATRLTGAGGPIEPSALSVAEHDRLLTRIFIRLYGERAECHATCAACSESFEFTLPLDRVMAEQDALSARWGEPDAEGWWRSGSGVRFRAPTVAEARQLRADALRAACLEGPDTDVFDLEQSLEAAAPTMSIDLDVTCPHCATGQRARFDIARHLARCLQRELPLLVREAHLIASRYGWTHAEIMALTRDDRRAYAALIARERSAAARPRRVS